MPYDALAALTAICNLLQTPAGQTLMNINNQLFIDLLSVLHIKIAAATPPPAH